MRHRVVMRGTWLVVGALALLAAGCGEASSGGEQPEIGPVERPTAVPAAEGRVTTNASLLVTDDGSGARMCRSGNWQDIEPPRCDEFAITGWDWDSSWDYEEKDGARWGYFTLTGTFDGSTFAVDEVSQPDPEPYEWDFEIPCPEPDGGWRVLDPALTTSETEAVLSNPAEKLPGFALIAVSTPDGEPAPRDPASTVVTVYVAEDPVGAEAAMREVWGGMLCVTEVEHSYRELSKVQHELLDIPGMTEVGSGNPANQVELSVFHDDGSIQRWADQEFGDGVVVVESNLRPAG